MASPRRGLALSSAPTSASACASTLASSGADTATRSTTAASSLRTTAPRSVGCAGDKPRLLLQSISEILLTRIPTTEWCSAGTTPARLPDRFLDHKVSHVMTCSSPGERLKTSEASLGRAAEERSVSSVLAAAENSLTRDGGHVEASLVLHPLQVLVLADRPRSITLLLVGTCVDVTDAEEDAHHAEEGQRSWGVIDS